MQSVLFFGRSNCDGTTVILNQLRSRGCLVQCILSKGRGEKLEEEILLWRGDYIICFRSLFILPKSLIDRARIAALNFHPAPPEYPGSGCVNFALHDNAQSYGVTAHLMNEKIDSGSILKVVRFPVNQKDTVASLLHRTHVELRELCVDFIAQLLTSGSDYIDIQLKFSRDEVWGGAARKMSELEELKSIDPSVTSAELERLVRATYIEGFPPRLHLHGYEFVLTSDEKKCFHE
jgi:methionyl-tRNA formyltransferase